MAYSGLTLALVLGVAIGTIIYYYFNGENNQRQSGYQYDDSNERNYNYDDYNVLNSSRRSSSSSQRRQRRNSSSKCSICLEDLIRGEIKVLTECGHEFHKNCISIWFQQNRICPNCRQPVSS